VKTLGLLGGMSWESTASYYALINEEVKQRLGGLHSARLLLDSVDFAEIAELQHSGNWAALGSRLASEACRLERAGADCVLLCTNTMHRVAEKLENALSVPLLHIADATGETMRADGIRRAGLLGTRFTMREAFYRERLQERFGLEVLTPTDDEQERVHKVIYEELCRGQIQPASREDYLRIIDGLRHQGAEAVILGCTEIALLVAQSHTAVPLYDTTRLHALKAVEFALGADA
jgi:aspartate racemase